MRFNYHYNAVFLRNPDASVLTQLGRNPHAAGKLSLADDDLSSVETETVRQYLAGFDIPINKQFEFWCENAFT